MTIAAENAALLRNYAMYRTLFPKPTRLEEFEGAQKQALQNLGVARDKWVAAVRKTIVVGFKTAGKGWFNLKRRIRRRTGTASSSGSSRRRSCAWRTPCVR